MHAAIGKVGAAMLGNVGSEMGESSLPGMREMWELPKPAG
jgi:hypothetical protein